MKFTMQNQIEREKQIKDWINTIKTKKAWRVSHAKLINSQIHQSQRFYSNLIKTPNGDKVIIRKFKIGNKKIIKRLSQTETNKVKESLIKYEKQ